MCGGGRGSGQGSCEIEKGNSARAGHLPGGLDIAVASLEGAVVEPGRGLGAVPVLEQLVVQRAGCRQVFGTRHLDAYLMFEGQ